MTDKLTCPHCGYTDDIDEFYFHDMISSFDEDNYSAEWVVDCEHCKEDFLVTETYKMVSRVVTKEE